MGLRFETFRPDLYYTSQEGCRQVATHITHGTYNNMVHLVTNMLSKDVFGLSNMPHVSSTTEGELLSRPKQFSASERDCVKR
jgi:hypothetical protein